MLLILLASAGMAAAQEPRNREEFMHKVLQLALENIQRAKCEKGEPCKPATEAEKKNPPLTLGETSAIVGRGIFSGGAAYCGLDWKKRNFDPMMAYWRNEKKKSERQLALIGLIHGIMQDQIVKSFADKGGACPEEIRKDVDSKLDFKP